MIKQRLIERTAVRTGVDKAKMKEIVEVIFDEISAALVREGNYTHRGFGILRTVFYKRSKRKNPMTGEVIDIPNRRIVHFKMYDKLKTRINK